MLRLRLTGLTKSSRCLPLQIADYLISAATLVIWGKANLRSHYDHVFADFLEVAH